jgi:hypothetical protein
VEHLCSASSTVENNVNAKKYKAVIAPLIKIKVHRSLAIIMLKGIGL